MEKLKCIVLDDDLAYCERVASYVSKHNLLELAGKFTDPEKARNFLTENPVPLVFIDMEMPGITGIEFLRTLFYHPYAIIITGHPDFAVKAFEIDAVDYIIKPFDPERFYIAVNRAIEHFETKTIAEASNTLDKTTIETDDYFFVRSDQAYIKLLYKDVRYIEALEDFVRIYIKDKEKPVITLINLKQLENTLPSSIFIRTHKSYIINMKHVTTLSLDSVFLEDKMLPVGPFYKDIVKEKIMGNKIIRR
jgi:two-component system, LytTR family, response regulator